jgi:hypothetical protein
MKKLLQNQQLHCLKVLPVILFILITVPLNLKSKYFAEPFIKGKVFVHVDRCIFILVEIKCFSFRLVKYDSKCNLKQMPVLPCNFKVHTHINTLELSAEV